MVIVFGVLALGVLVAGNWYLWRRLFRDTTRGPGLARRAGAAVITGGWLLAVGALVTERAGAPFWLQQVLAWPGFLWLALSVYLLLGVVAGEVVRPVLRRLLERRARATEAAAVPQTQPVPAGSVPRRRRSPGRRPGPGRSPPRSPRVASSSPASSPGPPPLPPWGRSATARTASCAARV